MRKNLLRLILVLACVAFGFAAGRSSRGRARTDAPQLAVGAEIVVAHPDRVVTAKDGHNPQAVYKTQRLRVFGWRGSETHLTLPPNELPAWRVTVAGKEYVAAPVD